MGKYTDQSCERISCWTFHLRQRYDQPNQRRYQPIRACQEECQLVFDESMQGIFRWCWIALRPVEPGLNYPAFCFFFGFFAGARCNKSNDLTANEGAALFSYTELVSVWTQPYSCDNIVSQEALQKKRNTAKKQKHSLWSIYYSVIIHQPEPPNFYFLFFLFFEHFNTLSTMLGTWVTMSWCKYFCKFLDKVDKLNVWARVCVCVHDLYIQYLWVHYTLKRWTMNEPSYVTGCGTFIKKLFVLRLFLKKGGVENGPENWGLLCPSARIICRHL